jgi:hypothetical protein
VSAERADAYADGTGRVQAARPQPAQPEVTAGCRTGQLPRCWSKRLATGQAPSDVFGMTVWVVLVAESCPLQKETPAS